VLLSIAIVLLLPLISRQPALAKLSGSTVTFSLTVSTSPSGSQHSSQIWRSGIWYRPLDVWHAPAKRAVTGYIDGSRHWQLSQEQILSRDEKTTHHSIFEPEEGPNSEMQDTLRRASAFCDVRYRKKSRELCLRTSASHEPIGRRLRVVTE
jgi:hypothetical protein